MPDESKFAVGDRVRNTGLIGTIREVKTGGYIIEYDTDMGEETFAFESELTKVEETRSNN